ncbi:MAG: rep helicase/DNA complex [Caudovirales sp. ctOwN3]|nr:MAG: rep helicase/DNA complex [Caudovirales sp. ctOwN3]
MQIGLKQTLILGAPGCGKTTRLLNIVEQKLAEGIPPEKIAYMSFTTKAVNEAIHRAEKKFGFVKKRLPFFRTVHSFCFRQTGASRSSVMGNAHYQDLARHLGIVLSGKLDDEGTGLPVGGGVGDAMLFVDNLARSTGMSLKEAYDSLEYPDFSWHQLKQFSKALAIYKLDSGLMDFTDMLLQYLESGKPADVDVAIIDEAQDLSKIQWQVIKRAFSGTKEVYIAGDDDQAIYKWSGADVDTFLSLDGEKEILAQSWRLPSKIHKLSQKVIKHVGKRFDKKFKAREEQGEISYYNSIEMIQEAEGSWLYLARNLYQLSQIKRMLYEQGIPFTTSAGSSIKDKEYKAIIYWERLRKGQKVFGIDIKNAVAFSEKKIPKVDDEVEYKAEDLGLKAMKMWHEDLTKIPLQQREYYLMILRELGPKGLSMHPKHHVSTIHGVKGGEADHVVLMVDMAGKSYREYKLRPDDETRVFYVGITRAKKHLHIVLPQTNQYFAEYK